MSKAQKNYTSTRWTTWQGSAHNVLTRQNTLSIAYNQCSIMNFLFASFPTSQGNTDLQFQHDPLRARTHAHTHTHTPRHCQWYSLFVHF